MIAYLAGVIVGMVGMYAALRCVWPRVIGPVGNCAGMRCVRCHAFLNVDGQTSMCHSDMAVYRNALDASRAALSQGWKKYGKTHLCSKCAANVEACWQEAIQ